MIFTVATMPPGIQPLPFRHGGERDHRMDAVQPVDGGAVDLGDARRAGIEVDPAGRRLRHPQPGARHRPGDARGRRILGQITRIEPGNRHLAPARPVQPLDLGGAEHRALLQSALGQRHRMGEHRALGHLQRDRPEPHSRRSRWVTSARTETAISAGVRAPMSSPTGAWMRADLGLR